MIQPTVSHHCGVCVTPSNNVDMPAEGDYKNLTSIIFESLKKTGFGSMMISGDIWMFVCKFLGSQQRATKKKQTLHVPFWTEKNHIWSLFPLPNGAKSAIRPLGPVRPASFPFAQRTPAAKKIIKSLLL